MGWRPTGRSGPFVLLVLICAALAACAPQVGRVQAAPPAPERPAWALAQSDIPVDPAYRFGQLDNGMRYAIRQNATPKGTALVRMEVSAGAIDESETERGFAHFVEHMAFNGSTRVPEGEMIRLLEREGLAFGADTNAVTSFNRTTYLLDLPRNEPALLDTALMLMRETASELTFSPASVSRERGVVLAEMRERNSWQLRNLEDQLAFINPGSLYSRRLPIGTAETVGTATAEGLKAFWRREYVPAHTTIVVVGDFPPEAVEALIRQKFSDWSPTPAEPQPDAGPVRPQDSGRADIYIDPALSERIAASRNGPWLDEPDTVAQRQENLLRQVGYGIINRRMQRIGRQAKAPFRSAGFGTGDVFRSGRTTNLLVDTVDGKWRPGLEAAVLEYRRAFTFGFSAPEVAEQVANIRTAAENLAASAETRSHGALVEAVFALLRDDIVPATPQSALDRLNAFIPSITPDAVLATLKREAVPLDDPLLRFQGRREPKGGSAALRRAWQEAMRKPILAGDSAAPSTFVYTDFGPPGMIAADQREPAFGIRQVRFANGVRLNLKQSELEKERVLVQLSIDGGDMLNSRENPLATAMTGNLAMGGLGKHSQDELQSLLAGRTVGAELGSSADAFVASSSTTPRDLDLQLQLMTAYVTDPGYRPEGEVRYRQGINNFFAQLRATPLSALTNGIDGILSDNHPRFTLQPVDAYRKLTFAGLKGAIADRLAKGAIEIGMVGDFEEDQAIALVAKTLGALPPREPEFSTWEGQRTRPFTSDRSPRILRHTGPKDQALLRYTWPTRDDSDQMDVLGLELLERIVRIELTENLREKLGKAYSPSASSRPSHVLKGYGVFGVAASVDVHEIAPTRAAIAETLASLRDTPVDGDMLLRARQPMLEEHDNALKTNRGWLSLVVRGQSEPDRISRFQSERDMLLTLTPARIQALARQYLAASDGIEVLVLPEGIDEVRP